VEEVDIYLTSYDLLKEESEARLRDGASRLRDARDFQALSQLVCLLADSGGGGRKDREAVELARDLTTPTVASLVVAQLAAVPEGRERERLARVLRRIGREGAVALADALGESRDRRERRVFLDTLVSLGPLAMETAQQMLDDPRWFVVRNGVAVLGELEGEDVMTPLTGTLAHDDARVRRETVLALAKHGGSDAEALIQGMLADGSSPVRSVAARALGVLGSQGSVRDLLDLLKDDETDVQVEAIQALGNIGDPGAVPAIEKKAHGGLFSRAPREVRISAFRALAAIGTPGAMKALEKGAGHRDEEIRSVVRSLLA
jgi:HEAT repeat protein